MNKEALEKIFELAKQRINEDDRLYFYDLDEFLNHIFTPYTNGGYHSEYLIQGANNLQITKNIGNGMYVGKMDNKSGKSNFFPKDMSIKQVINECIEAFNNPYEEIEKGKTNGRFGKSKVGNYIILYLVEGKIVDAFPAYKQDDRYYTKISHKN